MCGFFSDDKNNKKKSPGYPLKEKQRPVIPSADDDTAIYAPKSQTQFQNESNEVSKEEEYDPIESMRKLKSEDEVGEINDELEIAPLNLDDDSDDMDSIYDEKPDKSTKPVVKKTEITEKDFELEKIRDAVHNPIASSGKDLVVRVNSGIKGFDQLVEGGFPEGSLILLSGGTGTGKSTFAMNFLMEGLNKGDAAVYITLEEPVEETVKQMKNFGWDVESLIKKRELAITQPELYDFTKLIAHIQDSVSMTGAKRLVIDSISVISLYFNDPYRVRRAILDLENTVKKLGCTTLAIAEIPEESKSLSVFGVEEFIADGIIILYYMRKENLYTRAITVRKMRATDHSLKIHPLKIKKPEGVVVYPNEELFSDI